MQVWHPRLFAVGIAALLVAVLRFLSYDDPGSGIQLAMQVMMLVPIAIAAVILVPRIKADRKWLVPVLGFAASIPALLYAWSKRTAGSPGDERCAAKGFVPLDWTDAMEELLFIGSLGVALIFVVVGIIWARRPGTQWQGFWSLMAAGVLIIEWYAAPVCVGT
jgi:hypothetical protein